jgi:hypothetical protein
MRNVIMPLLLLLAGTGQAQSGAMENTVKVYTLYRDSPFLSTTYGAPKANEPDYTRVHVATFNSETNDPTYNLHHCKRVARLYTEELNASSSLPSYDSKFWCEEGQYSSVPTSAMIPPEGARDF